MLTFTGFISSIGGYSEEVDQIDTDVADVCGLQEDVIVTCRTFGFPGEPLQEIVMSLDEAEFLYSKIGDLQIETACDPLSDKIQQLQHEIIIFADEHNLLPAGVSEDALQSCLYPSWIPQNRRLGTLPFLQSRGSEFLCTFVSTGSGAALPVIALPRFIPIIMIPIPRIVMWWRAQEALTSCGGLRSGTGFIAYGQQDGLALGFWGIGFTFSLPPFMGMYGLIGYALFAKVNAEDIEFYPPNSPPVISNENPPSGTQNIPVSLSELSFKIEDSDGDLMSYSVTTEPYIGSGSGNNKKNGFYTIAVSGLEPEVEYKWTVTVTDGKDTVVKHFTFTTEAVAPVVSNPSPPDDARDVPVDLSQLSFHLKDFQGDLMDITVETSPDIGSYSATGVGDGTYTVDVSGLDYSTEYKWYVNATDGAHWTREIFNFQTELQMVFDPFDEGWQYRKKITIDHTEVTGNLTDFPVLVSTIDTDLRDKAQDDGDDILFMDGPGVANRLYHEIEKYDGSSGELVSWVNVPSLSSTVDTVFYMYYGNPSCSNQQFPEKVWDSNYMAVWHMNNLLDSTGNNIDLTNNGASPSTSGKIGNCYDFVQAESDYMYHGTFLDILPTSNELTFEVWAYHVSSNTWQAYISKSNVNGIDRIFFRRGDSNKLRLFAEANDGGNKEVIDTIDTVHGTWSYQVGIYDDNAALKIIRNTYPTTGDIVGTIGDGTDCDFLIGVHSTIPINEMDGYLDEIRVSDKKRSEEWISTQYNNQNDPSSFLSFGPEETGP